MPAVETGTLDKQASRDAIVIHVVMRLQGGGGNTGAKHQNRMMQQSALASYLLEQGYELSWVTSTVDTLCNRFGLAKLQHVTAMPVGSQKLTALLALLKEASIAVPALPTPQTRKQAQGMPWQKPKKHKGDSMIDPSEYSFIPGFSRIKTHHPAHSWTPSDHKQQESPLPAQLNQQLGSQPKKKSPVMNWPCSS